MNKHIQQQWLNGYLPGVDCILFADGTVVIANTYCVKNAETKEEKRYWSPLCDTTIESLENYESDIWTVVDIYKGPIAHQNQQIVFGDGAMGNEGFVAMIDGNRNLVWAIFFTFSNPIISAKVKNNELICISELAVEIKIQLNSLTKISIDIHQI